MLNAVSSSLKCASQLAVFADPQDNVQHSHLFKNPDMLVSTFQRVDLPVVPILDQYTYVLYTDCDVYFRRPIHLDDFGECFPCFWAAAAVATYGRRRPVAAPG